MPIRRRNRGRRRRFRKNGSSSNKIYKVKTRKLKSKKLDTLIEKRIQAISRAEVLKGTQILIKRDYIFTKWNNAASDYSGASYDKSTNLFYNYGKPIDWDGHAVPLSYIPRVDAASVANVPAADVEETERDEVNLGYGVNVVGEIYPRHGKRINNEILIQGISLQLRLYIKKIHQVAQIAGAVSTEITNPPISECTLYYAIVVIQHETFPVPPISGPLIKKILRLNYWGYSKDLDRDFAAANLQVSNVKKIIKGSIKSKFSQTKGRVRFIDRYIKLKKPIEFSYPAADQKGEVSNKCTMYLVVRSDVPPPISDDYKPWISCCSKLYYTDS